MLDKSDNMLEHTNSFSRKEGNMAEEYTQVNVNLTLEDARMLDHMSTEDAYENRSAFMRRLVRQEWARRYSQPNPLISVADAMLAHQTTDRDDPTQK
jgi:Arc/MetJ-type ribon-helix-helix transcriptional regulator